jgi:hypothetical protein
MNNNTFQLTFPDEWKETTVHTFEGPSDSGLQHNLVVTVLPELEKNSSIADYAKAQTLTSAQALPGYQLISQNDSTMFENVSGYEIVYKYMPSDDIQFFQKQWYFVINKRVYLFTSTFNKKTLKTIIHDVENVIRSLQTNATFEN